MHLAKQRTYRQLTGIQNLTLSRIRPYLEFSRFPCTNSRRSLLCMSTKDTALCGYIISLCHVTQHGAHDMRANSYRAARHIAYKNHVKNYNCMQTIPADYIADRTVKAAVS